MIKIVPVSDRGQITIPKKMRGDFKGYAILDGESNDGILLKPYVMQEPRKEPRSKKDILTSLQKKLSEPTSPEFENMSEDEIMDFVIEEIKQMRSEQKQKKSIKLDMPKKDFKDMSEEELDNFFEKNVKKIKNNK